MTATKRTRVRRWVAVVVIVAITAVAQIHFRRRPMLLWASGYDRRHCLEPLRQIPPTNWDDADADPRLFREQFTLNWDGARLYIDGNAGLTSSSYAPSRALVAAALPEGIGFAWGSRGSYYEEMQGPIVMPYWLPAAMLLSMCAAAALLPRYRAMRRHAGGRCCACGYDLKANVSGMCPECGERI